MMMRFICFFVIHWPIRVRDLALAFFDIATAVKAAASSSSSPSSPSTADSACLTLFLFSFTFTTRTHFFFLRSCGYEKNEEHSHSSFCLFFCGISCFSCQRIQWNLSPLCCFFLFFRLCFSLHNILTACACIYWRVHLVSCCLLGYNTFPMHTRLRLSRSETRLQHTHTLSLTQLTGGNFWPSELA